MKASKQQKGLQGLTFDNLNFSRLSFGNITPIQYRSPIGTPRTSTFNLAQHFSLYYISNLFTNAFLLSFYIVSLYIDHSTCRTKNEFYVTDYFDFVLYLGIVILLMDTFNSAVPCIYFRAKQKLEERKGQVSVNTTASATISNILEWIFRAIMILVSML